MFDRTPVGRVFALADNLLIPLNNRVGQSVAHMRELLRVLLNSIRCNQHSNEAG